MSHECNIYIYIYIWLMRALPPPPPVWPPPQGYRGRVYLWCTVSTDPRPPSPSRRVNDGSGPFWGKGAFGPLPKYWHFASTTCRQCLQLAGRVYLWCTVSTDPRPPSPSRRVNNGSGPFWGKGAFGPLPKYWHLASTTCRQCLQLAGRVYLWCTVSTDPRPPSPSRRVNDGIHG